MNQKTSRGGYGRGIAPIDLGHEPPLCVDGSDAAVIDHRNVSLRWFSGTILTGLCGAALIGGTVFASLNEPVPGAEPCDRAMLYGGCSSPTTGGDSKVGKTDQLPRATESPMSGRREVVRVTMTDHVNGREIPRVRPFIHLTTNLSMASDPSVKIPPFNPQRLLTDVGTEPATPADNPNNPDAVEPDAEVSFVTKDLSAILPKAKIAATVTLADAQARVREVVNWSKAGPIPMPPTPASFGTAPEPAKILNLMTKAKTREDRATGGNPNPEQVHIVKKGDTVASILQPLGATIEDARAIASTLGAPGRDGGLREGERLRIMLAPGPSGRMQAWRVVVATDTAVEAIAAMTDLGRYVAVDPSTMNTFNTAAGGHNDSGEEEEEDNGSGVRLYQSIYETALRSKVPMQIIDDMIRIYSYDLDFQRKVQPGDSFDVFYGDDENAQANKSEVLYAALTVGGETKKYYRYQSTDDGVVDYYDETGKSAKKFLVRKPVNNAVMRSGFGGRRHPILGYVKMHTGVDWAAPYGTPIFASGSGVIESAGLHGGYGKYIRMKHANGYETAYGHMSAFAKGIEPGKKVRQGQVIGYVGSSGLSTGPHCHYEILVNGRFVDPMRVKLPRGRTLEGTVLAGFEKQRDQVENMLGGRSGSSFRISDAR
ncbi:MAG: M23 family metallopeptidase [Alphaproteobacteria bacterium]|nr:M23 family metallopeptidase [Alphaproteobacteria bacterium]